MGRGWRRRVLARVGVVGVLVLSAAACEPAPPPVLVVNTDVDGADALPGDGSCEVTPGTGDCSVRAAVEEGNALGAAAITVPAGRYTGSAPVVVTGRLSINRGAPQAVQLTMTLEVAEGASLWLEGVSGIPGIPLNQIFVHGSLVAKRSGFWALGGPVLVVGPTGTAVLENSYLAGLVIPGPGAAVVNEGQVLLRHTWVHGFPSAIDTTGAGSAIVVGSVLEAGGVPPGPVCTGSLPASGGYNLASDASCALSGIDDLEGVAPSISADYANEGDPLTFSVAPGSPVIDAIPTGTGGCGADLVDDIVGAARPVDGDGDAIAACDIGPIERPAD